MKIVFKLILTFSLFGSLQSFAGDESEKNYVSGLYSYDQLDRKPKVFIEGIRLDFDYLRRNMQYVDFVNDPAVSDIHIIIASQTSGSGGRVYTMRFINRTFDNFSEYTLTCATASSDTEDESRKKITNTLSLGIMPYLNESDVSKNISIRYQSNGDNAMREVEVDDPWNNWTFRGDFDGGINSQENRKNYNYSVNIRIDKVTEDWKFRNNARINVRTIKNTYNSTEYKSEIVNNWFSSSGVKSLSPRWSVGGFVNYLRNSTRNTEYSVSARPAIEYNIFPWDVSDRKVFTFAYYVGPEWTKYYKETINNKFDEFLWRQSFRLNLQIVETWGEVNTGFDASNYLHDFSLNNISFDSRVSFRIVRGLSVNFRFNIEKINDQIYLPLEEFSIEDILQGNVQLPTSFEIGANVGFRIQFGSIYNNVVNNRL